MLEPKKDKKVNKISFQIFYSKMILTAATGTQHE
jgi:hypothetical protein